MTWFQFKYAPKRWSREWWLYNFWPPTRFKVDAWLRQSRDIVARELHTR